ncbi:MAG: hypothetical protein WCK02_14075 [Bacteroidota bacterium]
MKNIYKIAAIILLTSSLCLATEIEDNKVRRTPIGVHKFEITSNPFFVENFIKGILKETIDISSSITDYSCNNEVCNMQIICNEGYDKIFGLLQAAYGDKYLQNYDFRVWIIDNIEISLSNKNQKICLSYRILTSEKKQ